MRGRRFLAGALALTMVFGIGGIFTGYESDVSTVRASAEESKDITLTFIVKEKKVKMSFNENLRAFYPYTEDMGDGSYKVKGEKGKKINVNPSYFWIQSEDEGYFVTFWKDTETGKIYSASDEITPEKDMTFEAIWKKKVTLTYINTEGDISPYDINGRYESDRAMDTRSPINYYYGMDADIPHQTVRLIPELDENGNELHNEDGSVKQKPDGSSHLGWRCVGDGRGKLYQNMEDFYPTKDESFYCVWDTGWNEDSEGTWYLNEDKATYPVDCTVEIEGREYKFDKAGYLVKNSKPDDETTTDDETTDEETKPVTKGDANGDNDINVTDISVTAAHIKGVKALTDEQQKAADVSGDGELTVTDIAMIAAHIKGIKALS